DHAELGVSKDATQSSDGWAIGQAPDLSILIAQAAGEQLVGTGNRQRRSVHNAAWKAAFRVGEGGSAVVGGRGSALQTDSIMVHEKVSQIPIKTKLMVVVLSNLHELAFDVDLRRGDVQRL